ncbi:Zinc finger C2H2-type protein [Macrophomina phaseolina MS6]|uniref:Zinc finger C2H2-type protein n=1 Tax=Macrophomina phaseolina (strain MS6) TaxID=1126212 RepID=K2R9R3_MACPH|nr:Zinc finger C2H2-type protein [Macrophomina phaseolina MS6]
MRSPSPLAGSKRDSNGEVREARTWKRHMIENFGCEIETGECHRPICVNPQHLLVNGDTHDDLHRHKACLVISSHHDSPASSRHLLPLTTEVADICKESSCHVATPHSASDTRCEGMFWDSCSPTCSGDEACPIPDVCADPDCDLQDVCWDNLCTQVECTAEPCPDGLCLVDEVCYKEPCPRASSCEQTQNCAPHFGDRIDPNMYGQNFGPACQNASNQHLCQELENWIAANGGTTSNAGQPFHHCYNAHGQGNCHCNLPQYHSNGHCSHPHTSCYSLTNSMGRHGSSSLDELSRLAQLNEHMLNCTFPHDAAGSSHCTSTQTLGDSSIDRGSLSGSVVSSPDPHLPFRPHQQQNLSDFFNPSDLREMGFRAMDIYPEPPSKKFREMARSENAARTLFKSNDILPDFGVAQSVEETDHICLWQVDLKAVDGAPSMCNKKFSSAKDLADHMKEEHTEGVGGKYCCQWLGCTSSTDFKQSGKLARHFAIHSKYKRFQCKYCDKSFNTAQTLENHHNTHTGERPHACHYEGCTYAAATATQLKGHIQGTHLKEKRFQCKLCDFCCTDSSNLTKHENGVHGRKEYRCPHPGCTAPVTGEWSVIRKHLKESGHCPELLESNSQAQKKFKKAAVVKDQSGVMANGRRAPISRNRTKRSETAEQKVKSESVEPITA